MLQRLSGCSSARCADEQAAKAVPSPYFQTVLKENIPRLLLAFILVLIAACVALWWGNTRRLARANERVRHTELIEQRLEALHGALTELESGARGYALTGEQAFRAEEMTGERKAQERLADLQLLTADNPQQQTDLDELIKAVDAKLAFNRDLLQARDRDGVGGAAGVAATKRGVALMSSVGDLLARMRVEEERLLALRNTEADHARRQTLTLGVNNDPLGGCAGVPRLPRARRPPYAPHGSRGDTAFRRADAASAGRGARLRHSRARSCRNHSNRCRRGGAAFRPRSHRPASPLALSRRGGRREDAGARARAGRPRRPL